MNLLQIAKKTKCICDECHSKQWTTNGRPIFGNDFNSPKVMTDGRTLCSKCAAKAVASGEGEIFVIPVWSEKDRLSDYGEKYDYVSDLQERDVFFAYSGNNQHIKHRCMREEGNSVFVFGHGKSRYGRRYSIETFCTDFDVKAKMNVPREEDEEAKWYKRIDRAIKCLESSGLWAEYLEKLKNLRQMSLKDRNFMNELYWSEDYSQRGKSPKWPAYVAKYPFMFSKDKDGKMIVSTFYIWEISDVKLKSMYFGRQNKHTKELIKAALENKEKYSVNVRASYDVSYNYDPDKGCAWYAEEYRGCGNGHYYAALDHNTAWFCEND